MFGNEKEYEKHINQLGLRVKDKVTGYEGVVTTISFDLYGCVQAIVSGPSNDDGKSTSGWYDVTRLVTLSDEKVMDVPDFTKGYVAEGKKGAAIKPIPGE